MAKLLALLAFALVFVTIESQESSNDKPIFGQTFDEIVVSSNLNVRRKSKENRQGKSLLTNVPSGITGPPEKSTATSSRLVSIAGIRVTQGTRDRRGIAVTQARYPDLGIAGYLLKSRKR